MIREARIYFCLVTHMSVLWLVAQSCLTLWTHGRHLPGSSVQGHSPESWSGLPCPLPRDLRDPVNDPRPPALQADYLPSEYVEPSNNGTVLFALAYSWFNGEEAHFVSNK